MPALSSYPSVVVLQPDRADAHDAGLSLPPGSLSAFIAVA